MTVSPALFVQLESIYCSIINFYSCISYPGSLLTGSPPTPTLLTVTSVTSHNVVISWQIDTSTIPITGYMVRVVASTTEQVIFSEENLSPNTLMLTLRDLQPTTDYQFFISAFNTAGTGEQVPTQFRTISNGKVIIVIITLDYIV